MKNEPQIRNRPHQTSESFPLSVVIVYNDMHAALRAAQALDRLGRKFFGQLRQQLMPVPVAHLGDRGRFDRLIADAVSADIIIVSYNGTGDLPLMLKNWLAICLKQKQAQDSALIALLSSQERLDGMDSPRYQYIRSAAQSAGLDFFAPAPGAEEEVYPWHDDSLAEHLAAAG